MKKSKKIVSLILVFVLSLGVMCTNSFALENIVDQIATKVGNSYYYAYLYLSPYNGTYSYVYARTACTSLNDLRAEVALLSSTDGTNWDFMNIVWDAASFSNDLSTEKLYIYDDYPTVNDPYQGYSRYRLEGWHCIDILEAFTEYEF